MEALQPLLEALASATPILAAGLASAGLTWLREHVGDKIPPAWYPVLLPIAGGIVASLARLVGVDIGDFNPETADFTAWQTAVAGIMTGAAMVGLDQIRRQRGRGQDSQASRQRSGRKGS